VRTMNTNVHNLLKDMVGARGFEPRTSCAQGRRATRLRYAPTNQALILPQSVILSTLFSNPTALKLCRNRVRKFVPQVIQNMDCSICNYSRELRSFETNTERITTSTYNNLQGYSGEVSEREAAGVGRLMALAYSEANSSLSGYCSLNSRSNFCARAFCFSRRAARARIILAYGRR
jgi:hypothetical protein